jgi:hypothetical protein
MENIIAISSQIIRLSGTIQEGMDHLVRRMNEGFFEDNYYLFQDMVRAFSAIYDAMGPLTVLSPLKESHIMELGGNLMSTLDSINDLYENHELDKAQQHMQMVLLPAFGRWKDELDRCLHPLVDS